MKPLNTKDRKNAILRFTGIFIPAVLLTGFIVFLLMQSKIQSNAHILSEKNQCELKVEEDETLKSKLEPGVNSLHELYKKIDAAFKKIETNINANLSVSTTDIENEIESYLDSIKIVNTQLSEIIIDSGTENQLYLELIKEYRDKRESKGILLNLLRKLSRQIDEITGGGGSGPSKEELKKEVKSMQQIMRTNADGILANYDIINSMVDRSAKRLKFRNENKEMFLNNFDEIRRNANRVKNAAF